MKSFKYLAPSCLALVLIGTGAAAQPVYRCGNSYSQTPCTNATVVQTDDPRSEAQRSAAQQALTQDKVLAQEMETSRHKDEAMALARAKAEQAAMERNAALRNKSSEKKTKEARVGKKSSGLRSVKVQQPGVFTTTVEATVPKKTKSKPGTP